MKGSPSRIVILVATLLLSVVVHAQTNQGNVGNIPVLTGDEGAPPDWFQECTDPTNTAPLSTPYVINYVANELMFCAIGGGGAWTAGGNTGECFEGAGGKPVTKGIPNQGKFTFSYGNYQNTAIGVQPPAPLGIASVQQYSPNFHDAAMAINFGSPYTPAYCNANILVDGVPSYFGTSFTEFFFGQSNRYVTAITAISQFTIDLQVELVADAVRFRWTCVNNDVNPHSIALWFGSGIEMLTDQNSKYWPVGGYAVGNFGQPYIINGFGYGPDQSGDPPFFNYFTNDERLTRDEINITQNVNGFLGAYVYVPNQRPPDQDTQYILGSDPAQFPDHADFVFDQTDAFGIRMETKPSSSTKDTNPTNLPLSANELTVGKSFFIMNDVTNNAVFTPNDLLPDTGFLSQPCFVMQYEPHTVPGGQTFQMLNYVRSTWGNGDYKLPFGAVVDAPALVQAGSVNFDGTPAPSGLVNNTPSKPLRIPVWIDNVGGNVTSGYGVNDKEFELDNVTIKLSFTTPGITIIGPTVQTIPKIEPRTDAKVEFDCLVGPQTIGDVNYQVVIDTVPVNEKIITGTINVAGRPQNRLFPGANMISAPYVFQDNSWLTILQDYLPGGVHPATGVASTANFTTYVWDPARQTYDISLNSTRTGSVWVVYDNPTSVFAPYEGTPTLPATFANSTFQIELKPGWNMIADPFNIVYQLNEVNGVAAGDATKVYTFDEMVGLGYISGALATYDPTLNNGQGGYNYVDGTTDFIQPNVGYWIDVLLPGEITLSFPQLYTEDSPGSYDKTPSLAPGLWRLGLTAKQGAATDGNVVVGTAASAQSVRLGTIFKAPMAPTQKLSLSILGRLGAKQVFLDQALATSASSYSWTTEIASNQTGPVSLSWQNIAKVPKTFGVFVQDLYSGITTDARKSTAYGYVQLAAGVREFEVVASPTVLSTSLISAISGSAFKVGLANEEKISYLMSKSATTSVTIRSSNGALVATLHQQRVDKVGLNEDLWNLKTTLGAQVAAGKYTVEISAVTPTGEEQTKTAVITVL